MKPRRVTLTAAQVLARMKSGNAPRRHGSGAMIGLFDDGARASHSTMTALYRSGLILPPAHCSIHSRFTLATGADRVVVQSQPYTPAAKP